MIYIWIALAVIVVATIAASRRSSSPSGAAAPARCPLRPCRRRPVDTRPPEDAGAARPRTSRVAPAIETPEPTAGRLQRLRARLARSQSTLGRGLLSGAVPREARRRRVGRGRGGPADRRRRGRRHHRDRRAAANPYQGARHPVAGRAAGAARRGTGHRAAAGPGPHAAHDAVRGPARRGHGRRGERDGQDDHLRQAGARARRGRPQRAARRGRHVPRRGGGPARDLGFARRRRDGTRAGGR